jgi:hypothetical protein
MRRRGDERSGTSSKMAWDVRCKWGRLEIHIGKDSNSLTDHILLEKPAKTTKKEALCHDRLRLCRGISHPTAGSPTYIRTLHNNEKIPTNLPTSHESL